MAGNLHRAHLVIRGPKANAARLPRRTRPLIRPANLKRRSAPMPLLVLIRHGQSAWNLENRFTGWWDVDVTELGAAERSEEHTSELQSLMRISYAVFCWKKKKKNNTR